MILSGQLAVKWFFIAHLDRVFGIEMRYPAIFDKHTGHAVERCRNNEGIIEANLVGPRLDLIVPVNGSVAQAKMPLSDAGRSIARRLQHGGHRLLARTHQQWRIAGQDAGVLAAPSVVSS